VAKRSTGVLLLLAVLAGFPLLSALPNQAASVRVGGLSILWWYGGLAAPLAALAIAALGRPGRRG
jgi:arginine exporter protein ArgO